MVVTGSVLGGLTLLIGVIGITFSNNNRNFGRLCVPLSTLRLAFLDRLF